MTTPELVIWAVVIGVGFSSAWRNPTAVALLMSWFAGQAFYLITGDNLPVDFYLFPDVFVIAVVMSKQEICNLAPYRNPWHQLKCMLLERSPSDRVVLLIFPLMWALYGARISDYAKWWSLYFLVLAQFIATGVETFISYRRDAEPSRPEHTGTHQLVSVEVGFG